MNTYSKDFGTAGDDYRRYRLGYPTSLFEKLLEHQIGIAGQNILDIGTGTGALARTFASKNSQVIGTDIDERMLEQARAMSNDADLNIEYFQSKSEAIDLPSQSQDIVSAGQCWHWFKQKDTAEEVFRLLKPGGKLVIAHYDWIPINGNIVEKTEAMVLKHNPEWPHHSGVGIHTYGLRPLAEAGFKNITTYSYDEPAEYSHEAWRGRMRASNGVIKMSPETAEVFDGEMTSMLAENFPTEPMQVDHRVFYIIAEKNNPI